MEEGWDRQRQRGGTGKGKLGEWKGKTKENWHIKALQNDRQTEEHTDLWTDRHKH